MAYTYIHAHSCAVPSSAIQLVILAYMSWCIPSRVIPSELSSPGSSFLRSSGLIRSSVLGEGASAEEVEEERFDRWFRHLPLIDVRVRPGKCVAISAHLFPRAAWRYNMYILKISQLRINWSEYNLNEYLIFFRSPSRVVNSRVDMIVPSTLNSKRSPSR